MGVDRDQQRTVSALCQLVGGRVCRVRCWVGCRRPVSCRWGRGWESGCRAALRSLVRGVRVGLATGPRWSPRRHPQLAHRTGAPVHGGLGRGRLGWWRRVGPSTPTPGRNARFSNRCGLMSACLRGRSPGVIMGCAGVIMASAANFVRNVAAQSMITGRVRHGRGRAGRSGAAVRRPWRLRLGGRSGSWPLPGCRVRATCPLSRSRADQC